LCVEIFKKEIVVARTSFSAGVFSLGMTTSNRSLKEKTPTPGLTALLANFESASFRSF